MIDFIKRIFKGNHGKPLGEKQEITIGIQGNLVVIDFRKKTSFIAMDGMTALKMGSAIKKRAQECMKMVKK